jgi:diaminopimelate epimerase
MTGTPFVKMHGLGNDFVVLDARGAAFELTPARRRAIADRRLGVGCDQLIVLEAPTERDADVFMRIYNPDGGEAGACGNATRCVASVLMDERKTDHVTVQTIAGLLESQKTGMGSNGLPVISVDMGPARLDWRDIPVREACDTNHMPVGLGPLQDPVGTNMGNPHATFFVADAAAIPLSELGPKLEHDRFFPERANIGVAELLGEAKLRLRVWERGAGVTLACGSGACAALVAASRRGLVKRHAEVIVDGGTLAIEWLRDGHVLMTGGIALAFKGELDRSLLS